MNAVSTISPRRVVRRVGHRRVPPTLVGHLDRGVPRDLLGLPVHKMEQERAKNLTTSGNQRSRTPVPGLRYREWARRNHRRGCPETSLKTSGKPLHQKAPADRSNVLHIVSSSRCARSRSCTYSIPTLFSSALNPPCSFTRARIPSRFPLNSLLLSDCMNCALECTRCWQNSLTPSVGSTTSMVWLTNIEPSRPPLSPSMAGRAPPIGMVGACPTS